MISLNEYSCYIQGKLDTLTSIKIELEEHKSKYGFYPQTKYLINKIIPYWENKLKEKMGVHDEPDFSKMTTREILQYNYENGEQDDQ